MYYLTTLLAVLIVGTSNFISQDSYISEAVAAVDVICKAFTSSLKHWRKFEKDAVDAEVDFVIYSKAPKNDSEDSKDLLDYVELGFDSFLSNLGDDDNDNEHNSDYNKFHFDPKINRIAVIVHGYLGDHDNEWIKDLVRGLFHRQKNNLRVIVIDWFKSYTYYTAAGAVNEVAEKVFKLLRRLGKLYKKKNVEKPYLHIMGHSLGAHIAGLTAKKLQSNKKFNWTVDRVTGFDPAKPFFKIGDDFAKYRLDKSYAKFVDVIHTNSDAKTSTFGLYDALGHVDFYPNGGDYQPRCKDQRGSKPKQEQQSTSECAKSGVQKCLKGLGNDVACIASFVLNNQNMVCDHAEAQKYFTESLYGVKYSTTRLDSTLKNSNSKCQSECCISSIPMGIDASNCKNEAYKGRYNVIIPLKSK